ncbi:general secretion pathway protein GspE [Achromatium sp. WMS2]|nr:general secretion pathway protein GspE [Achromatium sp. WMS2]
MAKRLVDSELVKPELIEEAQEVVSKKKISLVRYLVSHKRINALEVAMHASQQYGLPLLDLYAIEIKDEIKNLIPEKLQRKYRILPLYKRGNILFAAVSDPSDHSGVNEINFQLSHAKLTLQMILVEEDKLALSIDSDDDVVSALPAITDDDLNQLKIADDEGDKDNSTDVNVEDEAPIVKYVNRILMDAIVGGASDIHFEPYEKTFRIRFRQDGMLSEFASPPQNLAGRISARLKVMSRMNIAERKLPQDGRVRLKLSARREVDFRVNTLPTLYGEKVVLRILDATTAKSGIDKLGFDEIQMQHFLRAIRKPYGMVLVTGPTGSGKTVSLYSALNILNEPSVNISTAEDPVEIQVPGINQVNVTGKLTFADALKSFLRQDPDVIMVGEIRDLETASIAVKAAQTGHMVLSTLHTNDAPQTLTRLANMGVPPFNIASAVLLIMAQRLARRLCEKCKQPEDVPKNILLQTGFTERDIRQGFTVYKAVGCPMCKKGYKGRVGLFQVMPVSEEMGRIIMRGGNSYELGDQAAKEGVINLRESGLNKVKLGIVSLEELNRVTQE